MSTKVVIVGAGVACRTLVRELVKNKALSVTVVQPNDFAAPSFYAAHIM